MSAESTTFHQFRRLPLLAQEEVYKNVAVPDLLELMLTSNKMKTTLCKIHYPKHLLTVTVADFYTTIRIENSSFGEFDIHYKDYQYPSNSTAVEHQINGLPVTAVKDVFGNRSSTKLFGDSHIAVARELISYLRTFMPRLEVRFEINAIRDVANISDAMTLPFETCKSLEIAEWELSRDQFSAILERIHPGADFKVFSADGFTIEHFSPIIKLRSFELNGVMEWFTPETFLKSDIKHIAVESSTVKLEHVKQFLRKWQSGEFSSVKTIHLTLDSPVQLEVPLPEFQAPVCKTTRRIFKDEDGEEHSCEGGHDVIRNDGTIGTFLIKQCPILTEFVFFVWEKEVMSNKRRRNDEYAADKRRRI